MTTDGSDPDLESARALAQHVIERLGPGAPTLRIDRVSYDHGFDEEQWESVFSDEPGDVIRIVVRAEESAIGAHLSLAVARPQAIADVATQIQDHVLECTHGAPLPPCPDHRHPLQASVVDGLASWVCPIDPTHHVEPILPPSMRTS